MVLTTHIRWGEGEEPRRQELERLADWIEGKRLKYKEDKDMIVMGDFNIPSKTSPLFKAITKHGLQLPSISTARQQPRKEELTINDPARH